MYSLNRGEVQIKSTVPTGVPLLLLRKNPKLVTKKDYCTWASLNDKFNKFNEQLIARDSKEYLEENSNNNVFYSQYTVFSCHRIGITNLQKNNSVNYNMTVTKVNCILWISWLTLVYNLAWICVNMDIWSIHQGQVQNPFCCSFEVIHLTCMYP